MGRVMLFRSCHIYIMLGSLLNLGLGTYLTRPPADWSGRLQRAGSILIISATRMLVVAFFYESFQGDLLNPPCNTLGPRIVT